MSKLRARHLFAFETDYGAVYALASYNPTSRMEKDDTTIYYDVGLSYCSPQDRSKPRKLRRQVAFKKCSRRMTRCPMFFGVPLDMQFAEYLKMRIAEEIQECVVRKMFPPQVNRYMGKKSRSAFSRWFHARGEGTFSRQFIERYCGEPESALDV